MTPLSRGQLESKGHGKLSIHCSRFGNGWDFSTNCLYKPARPLRSSRRDMWRVWTFHERTGRLVVMGQSSSSLVLSAIKKEVPSDCDDPANEKFYCNNMKNELRSCHNKINWVNFCMDAGFLSVVEIGQNFMTKDTAEFSQFTDAVACREYTLPRDEETCEPKGWIRGNTKIGPVLEVTPCCLQDKYELRSELCLSAKTILTRGSEFLMAQTIGHEFEQQRAGTSEVQFEEYALRLNASDSESRSRAQAKLQRRELANSATRTISIGERIWTNVEPGEYSISDYEVLKKLIHLLRQTSLHRENDGAIEFWRIKDNLQKHFLYCHHWSDDKWKKSMEREDATYGLQTLRSWRRWTHRKSTLRDSMQKKWYFPNKENLFFQSQMDESNFLEEMRKCKHTLWYGNTQFEEKVNGIFLENQKGLFHHFTTRFRMSVKL